MMLLKNTLTNVTCETLYRLHTPRPTWFGALKKKCSSKPPAATEELACKAFAGEIKRRLFSTPSSLQEHTFCVLCLTKEFPNFGGEGGKVGWLQVCVELASHHKTLNTNRQQKRSWDSLLYWRKHQGTQC